MGSSQPVFLEAVEVDELAKFFDQHKADWSPQRILRAKADESVATQLDFLDLDLMSLLDREVRTKLDRLLRDTVKLSVNIFSKDSRFSKDHYPPLFRLIFRLIAAKVLADRDCAGNWAFEDPQSAISAVEDLYFKDTTREPVLEHLETQVAVWERIRHTFHFQNLSVDSLAYVYENTLVTPTMRKLFGIHSTPPEIAEYIVRRLPFEDLETSEWQVFDPFSGHSVFLIAAMQRMRELLPLGLNSQQRHEYFVEKLSGIEIDEFAREVAKLSLMMADYPNPDGWRLYGGDALSSPVFELELAKANIVLCNPPFENFSQEERQLYGDELFSVRKPAEILHRVLRGRPKYLGFVLPRVFLRGRGYKELRSLLGNAYSSIEVLALPDRAFQHSQAEAVLLLCSGHGEGKVRFSIGEIYKEDFKEFHVIRPSYQFDEVIENAGHELADGMWRPPLPEVWEAVANMKRLGDLASIHRGIEYNLPFRDNKSQLISCEELPGFAPGVYRVRDALEPFTISNSVFLNVSPDLMRNTAHELPWDKAKLIVNSARQSTGPWKITASLDDTGLVCYQNLHGVWPKDGFSIEILAAVLNGPVGNAFVSTRSTGRHVTVESLRNIPIPEFDQSQQQVITLLVRQYGTVRRKWLAGELRTDEAHNYCDRLLRSIDAEVLKAYDLSPRVERDLLDYFRGKSRLGPVEFTEYFPASFRPHIPWHLYLSESFKAASAKDTLKRSTLIPESPLISEALSYMG